MYGVPRKEKQLANIIDEVEFYPTPAGLCRAALKLDPLMSTGIIKSALDFGAGSGVWGEEFKELNPNADITGVEIRSLHKPIAYDFWYEGDYLDVEFPDGFDLIFGNPPFSLAEDFIRKGLSELHDNRYMIVLVRLAFLESQKRHFGLFKEFPPKEVHVLSRRPSFSGNKKTNATAFAIFIWQTRTTNHTILDWLYWDYK